MELKTPTIELVEEYLEKWRSHEKDYSAQEASLHKLFSKTYPNNDDLNDVLIKVCALNSIYYTNIMSPLTVAKHIVALKIDNRLAKGELSLVKDIAQIVMRGEKPWNFYSFATKYCSHHRSDIYPIYDSYVHKLLIMYQMKDSFHKFSAEDLRDCEKFIEIIKKFISFYKLDTFNIRKIDRFLWLYGKDTISLNPKKSDAK